MDIKPYIAAFFALTFFGKFLIMDAQLLGFTLEDTKIAYVNPFCENKNGSEEPEISASSSGITLDSFCNTPLYLEKVKWENRFVRHTYQEYLYTTPAPPKIFRESFYPPPKLV